MSCIYSLVLFLCLLDLPCLGAPATNLTNDPFAEMNVAEINLLLQEIMGGEIC